MKGALVVALIAGAWVVADASSAAAQSNWKTQINRQINSSDLARRLTSPGYSRSHDPYYDLVSSGTRRIVRINLDAGRTYQIIGACDNDCSDLDLRLYDENDRPIASDLKQDDYPIVVVTPRRSARFRIDVIMARCSAKTCGWAVVA